MTWHATPVTPPRRRGGRTIAIVFLACAVIVIVLIASVGLYGRSQLEAPSSDHSTTKVITVHDGESVDDVITALSDAGLIKSSTWFSLYARFKGLGSVAAGDYRLDTGMGASAIVAALQATPDAKAPTIVLTEGMTAQQMATKIARAGLGITADQYLQEVEHGTFSESFLAGRPAGAALEGFLFPDTYAVPAGTSAHGLVQMQLDAFAAKAEPVLGGPSSAGLTAYRSLILASIVEREARTDADRPKVAGVLVNRLSQGMMLQVDATVAYGLGIPGQEPNSDQLKQDTPYNTYTRKDLPPTPISNPGVASITAAMTPASIPDLFYVSDGCGNNHYAVSESDFEKIKAQYVGQACSTSSGT